MAQTIGLNQKNQPIPVMSKLIKKLIMAHAGLEPATFALLARRSNQLS